MLWVVDTARIFVIHGSPIRHYNKSLTMKTTENTDEIQKNNVEKCEKKVSKAFKP